MTLIEEAWRRTGPNCPSLVTIYAGFSTGSSVRDEFHIKNNVITPSELPNLTHPLPDHYEPGSSQGGTTPFIFKGAQDSDINMMEQLIHKHRYYDSLGVWSPRIDLDKRVTAAIVRGLGARRCLEIGCFSAPVLSLLDDEGIEVTGIDASHLAFVVAYPNIRDRMLFGDLLSVQVDSPFDVVLGMDIIEHLNPLSLDAYLEKISSILSADGYVYINSPIFGRDDIFGEVFPLPSPNGRWSEIPASGGTGNVTRKAGRCMATSFGQVHAGGKASSSNMA